MGNGNLGPGDIGVMENWKQNEERSKKGTKIMNIIYIYIYIFIYLFIYLFLSLSLSRFRQVYIMQNHSYTVTHVEYMRYPEIPTMFNG